MRKLLVSLQNRTLQPWLTDKEIAALADDCVEQKRIRDQMKKKQAIKLASDDDIAKTLQMIAEAVEAGELDDAIAQQAGATKLKTKAT